MRRLKFIPFVMLAAIFVFSMVLAVKDDAVERGKTLFNDPEFAGGLSGKSCATCHPDGEGMDKAAARKEWKDSEGNVKTLEDMINQCIIGALEGEALDKNSEEMKDIVAYIKSFKKEAKMEEKEKEDLEEEMEELEKEIEEEMEDLEKELEEELEEESEE